MFETVVIKIISTSAQAKLLLANYGQKRQAFYHRMFCQLCKCFHTFLPVNVSSEVREASTLAEKRISNFPICTTACFHATFVVLLFLATGKPRRRHMWDKHLSSLLPVLTCHNTITFPCPVTSLNVTFHILTINSGYGPKVGWYGHGTGGHQKYALYTPHSEKYYHPLRICASQSVTHLPPGRKLSMGFFQLCRLKTFEPRSCKFLWLGHNIIIIKKFFLNTYKLDNDFVPQRYTLTSTGAVAHAN